MIQLVRQLILSNLNEERIISLVAADWDGDGFTDFTIYRPSTGYWHIMLAKNPILQIFMQWGVPRYKDAGA